MIMAALRERTKIVLFAVLVLFVGFIFFQWGMQESRNKGPHAGLVGSVNGREITADAYRKTRQQVVQSYASRAGHDPEAEDTDAIEQQTWLALVREMLLQEQVEKYGITISDAELLELLRTNPPDVIRQQFTNAKGEFDAAAYQQALNNPQLATQWANVEEYLRATLPADKLENYVALNARVTDPEVRESFVAKNEKARAKYVASPVGTIQLPAGKPSDDEVRAWYDAHKDKFAVGEQAVLEYVRVSKAPTAADSAAARADLEKLRKEIAAGSDFAEAAKSWSDDPGTAQKGGDLPPFAAGEMVPAFEKVAFATPVGQVSEVFETPYGLHILKVEDKKTENGKERVHVRHILLKVEASNETLHAATNRMDDFQEAAHGGKDWTAAAAKLSLKVERTPPFEQGHQIPGIGALPAADRFAFANAPGTVTKEPVEDDAGGFIYVFKVVEHRPPGTAGLDEVKERARAMCSDDLRRDAARKRLADAITAGGGTLAGVAKALGAPIDSTVDFTRESFIPGIGRRNGFVVAAFSLEPGKTSGLVDGDRAFYVLQVTQRTAPPDSLYAQQKDEVRRQLLMDKRQLLITAWIENLLATAKVVDFRSGQAVPWKPDRTLFTVLRPPTMVAS
ncbi:MAG: peptidylprolyl isomerase [bacterium]